MILIPSVTEEQLLPPDGQCSWQQYWIGYDLYFTWTGYYLIYATLTCISTQLSEEKNCSLVTLSLSPSVHIFLPMNYWMKRDVYISMCPINVNCLQLCIICILLLVYILYICIYMCDLLFQEAWSMKNRKAMNIYEQWTIMKVIIYFICLRSAPPDEFLIAVNICWQKKMQPKVFVDGHSLCSSS